MEKIVLYVHGGFVARDADGTELPLSGSKERAMIGMLAIAPNGTHTRTWLQEHLWDRSGPELGRSSLRRLLSNLRKRMGPVFDALFAVSHSDIRLRLERVTIASSPTDGPYLAGLELNEPRFDAWLARQRKAMAFDRAEGIRALPRVALPSVAVLPLTPVSGTVADQVVGDLMAQEIGRALSRSRLIEVISHLSTRRFTGLSFDIADVHAQLGAQYLVSGAVFVDGDQIQLNVDFLDLQTERLRMTRRYSGRLRDIFAGASDLIDTIAFDCSREMRSASLELAASLPVRDIDSHALYLASVSGVHNQHRERFFAAREGFAELSRRMPGNAPLHAWLAFWHILLIAQGWSDDAAAAMRTASDLSQRALDCNPACPFSLTINGMLLSDRQQDMSLGSARFSEAVDADPNLPLTRLMMARMDCFLGKGAAAVRNAEKAQRLSPVDPHVYFFDLARASAYLVNGDYDLACDLAERSLARNPLHTSTYRTLAMAQQMAGRGDAARATVRKILELDPDLTVRKYLRTHPAGQLPVGRIWGSILRDAGVPA